MNQVLVYSRQKDKHLNSSIETICEKLNEIGYNTEQTHSTHLARLLLNDYQTIHLFITKLPLTVNEMFFLSFAKTLGKSTLLSLFDPEPKQSKPLLPIFCPDALTMSQTNQLKYFRDWSCTKSLLPLLPIFKAAPSTTKVKDAQAFLIPLEKNLDEVFLFQSDKETYFDGRTLLKAHSSTQLRKQWNQFLHLKKISSDYHLILSDDKIDQLVDETSLQVVLASPHIKHTEFTSWLQKTLNQEHCIVLNEFQATSFSHAWTTGRNCQVLSTQNWPKSFNQFAEANDPKAIIISKFKNSELVEPLINELSRLYTKVLRQKTNLISADITKAKS